MIVFGMIMSFNCSLLLYCKITQDLDYEDPRNLAAGGIYEMALSVSDSANPSHTGELLKKNHPHISQLVKPSDVLTMEVFA